jgi:hypothetical protein
LKFTALTLSKPKRFTGIISDTFELQSLTQVNNSTRHRYDRISSLKKIGYSPVREIVEGEQGYGEKQLRLSCDMKGINTTRYPRNIKRNSDSILAYL